MTRPTLSDLQGANVSSAVRLANPHLFAQKQPANSPDAKSATSDKPTTCGKKGAAKRSLASAVKKRRKRMNRTETEFARILQSRADRDEIVSFDFEGFTLRWGTIDSIAYTPDFTVVEAISRDGITDHNQNPFVRLTFVEVKNAHIWPKDIQKFKAARNEWPLYNFELWQKKKGQWSQLL